MLTVTIFLGYEMHTIAASYHIGTPHGSNVPVLQEQGRCTISFYCLKQL